MTKNVANFLAGVDQLLGSSAWFKLAKRAAAMVCVACSFLTSMYGAFEYFTESLALGGLLCVGIQLGLYGFSHGAADSKTRRTLTCWGWLVCFCFSVYLSSLGFYAKQFGSVSSGRERESVGRRWDAAQVELRRVQAEARGWLKEALDKNGAELEREHRRVDWRRGKGLSFSTAGVERLKGVSADLESARAKFDDIQLNAAAPDKPGQARERLQDAFSKTAAAFDAMPQAFRDTHKGATPPGEEAVTKEIQASFFEEVLRGSKPVLVVLIVAMLLDLLPVLLLQSEQPRRNKAEEIRRRKKAKEEIRLARQENVRLYAPTLRVIVEGVADFDGVISFGSDERALYPEDLSANFDELADMLGARAGLPLRIVSAVTDEGMELIPGIPLVSQFGDSPLVRLRAEPVAVEVA